MAYKNLDRKMPAKGLVVIAIGALLAGLIIPTYWVAAQLNFHPDLLDWVEGSPVPIYIPGQVVYWFVLWSSYYPSIFVPAMIVLCAGFGIFCALIRHVMKRND